MMKILILVAFWVVSLTLSAKAETDSLSISGYYNTVLYAMESDTLPSANKTQILEDAEIIFNGKKTLDNGIEVGLQVQLEATNQRDQIDEHYIYLQTDWGKLIIGAENSAAYLLQVHAPNIVGWQTHDNNFNTWSSVSNFTKPQHNLDGDANKISYFTPRINGLQFAFGYAPDNSKATGFGATIQTNRMGAEVFSYGMNYETKLGDTHIAVSLTGEEAIRHKEQRYNYGDAQEKALGVQVQHGPLALGGNLYEYKANAFKTELIHFGFGYEMNDYVTLGALIH
ncbi:MAG: porin, partial [Alphaproteobacteria bacterium]|nr:porin [Alphaproteobacteria bacterium]